MGHGCFGERAERAERLVLRCQTCHRRCRQPSSPLGYLACHFSLGLAVIVIHSVKQGVAQARRRSVSHNHHNVSIVCATDARQEVVSAVTLAKKCQQLSLVSTASKHVP
ncbi:hypothetical protein E2C01_074612 [Portunus trituberculatus]|uniref:Uncharacterized protein n=1 Tax=Portunus trituberculatus TaxID=210409 RepID=A0A5B7IDX9_PORTR|nr:hypothetical protein [Portunus trituberculatus]